MFWRLHARVGVYRGSLHRQTGGKAPREARGAAREASPSKKLARTQLLQCQNCIGQSCEGGGRRLGRQARAMGARKVWNEL